MERGVVDEKFVVSVEEDMQHLESVRSRTQPEAGVQKEGHKSYNHFNTVMRKDKSPPTACHMNYYMGAQA